MREDLTDLQQQIVSLLDTLIGQHGGQATDQ